MMEKNWGKTIYCKGQPKVLVLAIKKWLVNSTKGKKCLWNCLKILKNLIETYKICYMVLVKMIRYLFSICRYFPRIRINSRISSAINKLNQDVEPEKYVGMVVISSFVFGLIVFVIFGIVGFLLFFTFSVSLFLVLPIMEFKKKTTKIEAELPFFLRSLGTALTIGIGFEKSLNFAGSKLKDEISLVLKEIESGGSVHQAFARFAIKFNSLKIKRAISQLLTVYDIGSTGSEMKKIGDEMLNIERHKLKQHGAKSAIFGLLFILSSLILPTFFLVYAIAGRAVFSNRNNRNADTRLLARYISIY